MEKWINSAFFKITIVENGKADCAFTVRENFLISVKVSLYKAVNFHKNLHIDRGKY